MSVAVETFYGTDDRPYMTRVSFTDWLVLHVFHRGDEDPDPHDHRRAFVTFPLRSYVEEVYHHAGWLAGKTTVRVVRAGRPHFRGRVFTHRVLGLWSGERDRLTGKPLVSVVEGEISTLVCWLGRKRKTWGFWCWPARGLRDRRRFVEWRDYIDRGIRHG